MKELQNWIFEEVKWDFYKLTFYERLRSTLKVMTDLKSLCINV